MIYYHYFAPRTSKLTLSPMAGSTEGATGCYLTSTNTHFVQQAGTSTFHAARPRVQFLFKTSIPVELTLVSTLRCSTPCK